MTDKTGQVENMKLDAGEYKPNEKLDVREDTSKKVEDVFPVGKKETLETLDWSTDIYDNILEDDTIEDNTPEELKRVWAEREAHEIIADFRQDNPSTIFNEPNIKGSMYIPTYDDVEDYSDDKNLRVQQLPDKLKMAIGTRSELRRELYALKEAIGHLNALKPHMGPASWDDVAKQVNKDILPRIKWLESQLSLNVSKDYVNGEIKELGNQIAEKYNLTEDMTADEYQRKLRRLEGSQEDLRDEMKRTFGQQKKEFDKKISNVRNEGEEVEKEVYETLKEHESEDGIPEDWRNMRENMNDKENVITLNGRKFYTDENGDVWELDFSKEE